MEQALSLEETNALRLKLGLRPIPAENPADNGVEWNAAEQAAQAARAADAKARIESVSDRVRHRKTVAGAEKPAEETSSWLQRMRQRPKPESGQEAPVSAAPDATPVVQVAETVPVATKPRPFAPVIQTQMPDSDRFEDTFDALEKEVQPVRQAESDYAPSKAKFKPRKKRDRRHIEPSRYENVASVSLANEEDDLYKVLAENRRRKQQPLAPEDIARQVTADDPVDTSEAPQGIVVSSTTDFLMSMRRRKVESPDQNVGSQPALADSTAPEPEDAQETAAPTGLDSPIEPEEPDKSDLVSGGLAATLRLLKSRGVVKNTDHRKRKNHDWLQKVASQRLQREIELRQQQEAAQHLPAKQRAEVLGFQDQQNAREERDLAAAQFKGYTPVVDIEHRDDEGNLLDAKQAFKHLSHKFHGNAEGRKRAQKRLSGRAAAKEEISKPLFD